MKNQTVKIVNAGSTGFQIYAELSNGVRLEQKTSGRPYAYDHLVSDIASVTGQTTRGVRASLRKWIA